MSVKDDYHFDRDALGRQFAQLAIDAGSEIMSVYRSHDQGLRYKEDQSPLTYADERAEAIIIKGLKSLLPSIPIIAEEAIARGERSMTGSTFILVDALDGTREFINRNGEFTVNIALIHQGTPICGAVYAPALHHIWYAGTKAYSAELDPAHPALPDDAHKIHCRPAPSALTALISRSHHDPHTDQFLQHLPIAATLALGSSLKMCKIAEGEADIYARFTPTMEWDLAAGHAIILAAGGFITDHRGANITYGKHDLHNPPFICWGDVLMKNKHFSSC